MSENELDTSRRVSVPLSLKEKKGKKNMVKELAGGGMKFSVMRRAKCAEMYRAALDMIRKKDLEEAILLLHEAEFFAPEDPTPLVAHAECYVYLCDLPSAIRYYRRALWAAQKRDKMDPTEKKPAPIHSKSGYSSAIPKNKRKPTTDLEYPVIGSGISGDSASLSSSSFLHQPFHKENAQGFPMSMRGRKNLMATMPPSQVDEASILNEEEEKKPSSNGPNSIMERLLDEADAAEESTQTLSRTTHLNRIDSVLEEGSCTEVQTLDASMRMTPLASNCSASPNNSGERSPLICFVGMPTADIQQRLAGLLDAMGLVLFKMNDFSNAIQYAEDSLDLMKDPLVELHRCIYLISLGREEEAEAMLESHMKSHKDCRPQSAALLLNLLVNRQAFKPARVLMEKYASSPNVECCLAVARHIFHTKYDRYRSHAVAKKDILTISTCIDVFPNDVELLFARAKIYIEGGDLRKSVKDLFRCVKETNGTHKEAIELMTNVLFSIGSNLDGEEGIQDAVQYYTESLKWRPDNTLVMLARGDCYVKLEDYQNALTDYKLMLQINPEDQTASRRIAFLHDLWGRKLFSQKKVKEAENEFTNALRECDTEPLFYYHRALCRFHLGEARFGLRDVLSCQQLHPQDPMIQAFILRYLGSMEVPSTSKVFQDAQRNRLVQKDPKSGKEFLTPQSTPPSSINSMNVAQKLYGKPSSRIAKALINAGGAPEAMGRGAIPVEEAVNSIQGASSRCHIGFMDFVCRNAPEGALTIVSGEQTKLISRDPPVRRQKVVQRESTKGKEIKKEQKKTKKKSSASTPSEGSPLGTSPSTKIHEGVRKKASPKLNDEEKHKSPIG